jgi:sugar lactone lactonase YvrE
VRSLPDRALYAYDYDSSSGSVTNPRKFWQNPSNAEPDGFALDTEGHLWQALYGDGKVVRLSPEGEVVGEVKLLTKAITSVCFVGEDIFITTAAEAEPEKYPESAKYGGALFKVHVGKTGVKRNKARFSEEVMKKFGLK